MDRGSSGIFGGIFVAIEIDSPLEGGEEGDNSDNSRARVSGRNSSTKNYPEK